MASPFDSDGNDRERPSWREIDRRRDRSRHVSRDKPRREDKVLRSPYAKKQYLKEVEKLFQGPKASEEQRKALDDIHRHYGTSKFAAAVRKYLKTFGLPSDWSTLMLLLDFKDDGVLVRVIEALKDLAPERSPLERQGFIDKLEILSITASSSNLISLAEKTIKEL